MSERVEVRATVNLPGLPVGMLALVDPEIPFIATCLDSGMIVATGRTENVPVVHQRQAVRPSSVPAATEDEPAKPRRRRATATVEPPRDPAPS